MNIFANTQSMSLDALDAEFTTPATPDVLETVNTNPLLNTTQNTTLDVDPTKKEEPKAVEQVVVTEKGTLDILDKVSNELIAEPEVVAEGAETETAEQKGRPKVDKNALIEYLNSKIESQDYGVPADYDTKIPVKDYLSKLPEKDLFRLLDSNWTAKEQEVRNSAPQEFYEALPDPVKIVAEYAAKGGNDWDALFSSLVQGRQVTKLDPNNEEHHVPIVKTYLEATTQMTPAQINEQIEDWKDNGKLDKKAVEFKAPLDAIQESYSDHVLKQAEEVRQQESELAQFYADNVYKQLSSNELAGIKLDKKFAKEFAINMTSTAPGPFTGRPVNYLGYGLEKCQYTEPDYEAVMLAAWLLNDKKSALEALGLKGANAATEKAVQLIKLNQGIAAGSQAVVTEPAKQVKRLPDNSRVLKRAG